MEEYLRPTPTIDCDTPAIAEKARHLTKGQQSAIDRARSIFYFVRDEIRYSFLVIGDRIEDYVASATLARGEGFCVPKAVLLTALARAAGIPTRLRFAVIRNSLTPEYRKQLLGSDLFVTHGYNELYIEGRWVKAAPTFDRQMCQEKRLVLVEFDGINDAVLPSHTQDGQPHIEYVQDHGHYADLPFQEITNWRLQAYGSDFFTRYKDAVEARRQQKQGH